MTARAQVDSIIAMRSFVPALDFARSATFYAALGFEITPLGDAMAHVSMGPFCFLLQAYDRRDFAEQFMMHLLVRDLDAWWTRIDALDLAGTFGVPAPKPPAMQPWGLRVAYVFDPAGVLWHVAEEAEADA